MNRMIGEAGSRSEITESLKRSESGSVGPSREVHWEEIEDTAGGDVWTAVLEKLAPLPTWTQSHFWSEDSPGSGCRVSILIREDDLPPALEGGGRRPKPEEYFVRLRTAGLPAFLKKCLKADVQDEASSCKAASSLDVWIHDRVFFLASQLNRKILTLDADLVRWLELNWCERAKPELGILLYACMLDIRTEGVLQLSPALECYLRRRLDALHLSPGVTRSKASASGALGLKGPSRSEGACRHRSGGRRRL